MGNFVSLVFYFVVFFISFLFYKTYLKRKSKLFLFISFMTLFLVSALRYNVGTDYFGYVNMYKNNLFPDIGFKYICNISSKLSGQNTMFAIYSFLTLMFFYLGLEQFDKKNRPLCLLAYLFLFFTSTFNGIRQALALSIVFYSYQFAIEKNFFKWFLFILLAFIFHNTALLVMPFYFLINNENKFIKFLILIVAIICSYFYIDIINLISRIGLFGHFSIYAREVLEAANNKSFYLDLLLLIYFLVNLKKMKINNSHIEHYFILFLVGIIFEFTGFLNPFVKRMSSYFLISKIYLLSGIPISYQNYKDKILNVIIIYIYIFVYFIISVFILNQSNVIPYDWIINK